MSKNKSPWGSGSGNGGSNGGKTPWGQGSSGQRPKPGATNTDNVIQDFKDRFGVGGPRGGSGGPGGASPFGKAGPFGLIALVALMMLLFSCVYMVDANEEGIVLRFGKYTRTADNGLHFKLPSPIEQKIIVDVDKERGFTIPGSGRQNLMLTGDENIVQIEYTVLWNVNDPVEFIFNLRGVPNAVSDVAESAMREVVGKTNLQPLITDQRDLVAVQVQTLMQEMMDEYEAGVTITQVEIKQSQEPRQVEKAFLDVVSAKQDAEQAILKARETENELIPKANADADTLIQEAKGYKEAVIAESKGDAARFVSIYEEYKLAPRVTRDRMYLETMEKVYSDADKIIMDDNGGSGVVPYLPLDQLKPKKQ